MFVCIYIHNYVTYVVHNLCGVVTVVEWSNVAYLSLHQETRVRISKGLGFLHSTLNVGSPLIPREEKCLHAG